MQLIIDILFCQDMSLSPPQKYTGLLSGDAFQRAEFGITRHIEGKTM